MHFNRLTIGAVSLENFIGDLKEVFYATGFSNKQSQPYVRHVKMFTETQHRVHECSEKAMPLVNLLCSNSELNRVVRRMVTLASENWNKRVFRVGRGFVHKEVVNV